MKRIKPSERNARPNKVVYIVATSIIRAAANDRSANLFPKAHLPATRIERKVGKGQYLGYKNKVTAFVWLEDEPEVLKAA